MLHNTGEQAQVETNRVDCIVTFSFFFWGQKTAWLLKVEIVELLSIYRPPLHVKPITARGAYMNNVVTSCPKKKMNNVVT